MTREPLTAEERRVVVELTYTGFILVRDLPDCTIRDAVDQMRDAGFGGHTVTAAMEKTLEFSILLALFHDANKRRLAAMN